MNDPTSGLGTPDPTPEPHRLKIVLMPQPGSERVLVTIREPDTVWAPASRYTRIQRDDERPS